VLIALIAPIDLLDVVFKYNTGYHLVLPQIMEESEAYSDFYSEIDGFKIVDNGAAEGNTIYYQDLHAAAEHIGADEIVVPDVMGSCTDTMIEVKRFEKWALPDQFNYAGVVQGDNMAEVMKCLTFYDHLPWISNVHIPRILNRLIHKTFRMTFLDALVEATGSKFAYRFDKMHCLGASEWVREAAALAEIPNIRGMDTSLPFNMGMAGRSLDQEYIGRRDNYFYNQVNRTGLPYRMVEENVRRYLDWAGCPYKETPGGSL
jgi:hypothetical protein